MCFGACLLRPCTWSGSQKTARSRTYNAPGTGFWYCLEYGQQTGGRQEWNGVLCFFLNSVLLGVGLAMDAFSVSMANGLHDPKMRHHGQILRAPSPVSGRDAHDGWVCVHTIVELFSSFETFIPWIALALLGYIGGKMLVDGIRGEEAEEATQLSAGACSCRAWPPASMRFRWALPSRNTAG